MPWENGSILRERANYNGDENRQTELLLNCLVEKTNIVELRVNKKKNAQTESKMVCEKLNELELLSITRVVSRRI